MQKEDWDRMTTGRKARANAAELRARARNYDVMADTRYLSGYDNARRDMWRVIASVYDLLAQGADATEVADWARASWARYAQRVRETVANAPRITHGPSSGLSTLDHRYVANEEIEGPLANAIWVATG